MTTYDPAQYTQVPSLGRRIFAFFLDQMLAAVFFAPLWLVKIRAMMKDEDLVLPWRWLVGCVLIQFVYRWMFLYYVGGTPGKLLLGLRVVTYPECKELSPLQSFIRVLTDSLSVFLGYGPRALALIRFDQRQLSDVVAETWVREPRRSVGFQEPEAPYRFWGLVLSLCLSIAGLSRSYVFFKTTTWTSHGLERIETD